MTQRHHNAIRQERIAASPQFDGRTFRNTHPVSTGLKPGVERPSLRDFLCGGERRVPARLDQLAADVRRLAAGGVPK